MDDSGKRRIERFSSRNVDYLVSRVRETIYAHCDVEGFKARLVSALLGPPPAGMAVQNGPGLRNGGAGNASVPTRPAESSAERALIGSTQEKFERFGLTRREAEVLRLVARGQTNKEIAASLYVSPLTIRTHLEHAYHKLGVGNRAQAVARVLGAGSSDDGPG